MNSKTAFSWWPALLYFPGAAGVFLAEAAVRISPEVIVSLAPFGVIFPISWMLLVIGTIAALFKGIWKSTLVLAVLIMISWPNACVTWGWNASWPAHQVIPRWGIDWAPAAAVREPMKSIEMHDAELRILSWNVRQFNRFFWIDQTGIQDSIVAYMASKAPDVICIQECYLEKTDRPWMSREALIRGTGLSHWQEEFKLGRGQKKLFGLVIMSRFPIVGHGAIGFENDENNSAMYVDVLVEGDTLRVFNTHMGSIGFDQTDYEATQRVNEEAARDQIRSRMNTAWRKRAFQAELVSGHVQRSPYPVVLAGDFNDTPVSYAVHRFQPWLEDAYSTAESQVGNTPWLGATYSGELPFLRIDHVLHSPVFRCVRFETGAVQMADHRPLIVDFALGSGPDLIE